MVRDTNEFLLKWWIEVVVQWLYDLHNNFEIRINAEYFIIPS